MLAHLKHIPPWCLWASEPWLRAKPGQPLDWKITGISKLLIHCYQHYKSHNSHVYTMMFLHLPCFGLIVVNRWKWFVLSRNIPTLHLILKPFDLKEVDIMVSFPDSYPQEVKPTAFIYTTASVIYYSVHVCHEKNPFFITLINFLRFSHWTYRWTKSFHH